MENTQFQVSHLDCISVIPLSRIDSVSLYYCISNNMLDMHNLTYSQFFNLIYKLKLINDTKFNPAKSQAIMILKSLLNTSLRNIEKNKTNFREIYKLIDDFKANKSIFEGLFDDSNKSRLELNINYSKMLSFVSLAFHLLSTKLEIFTFESFRVTLTDKLSKLKVKPNTSSSQSTNFHILKEMETVRKININIFEGNLEIREIQHEVITIFFMAILSYFPSLLSVNVTPYLPKIEAYLSKLGKLLNLEILEKVSLYYRNQVYYSLYSNYLISIAINVQELEINCIQGYFLESSYLLQKGQQVTISVTNDSVLKQELQGQFNTANANTYKKLDLADSLSSNCPNYKEFEALKRSKEYVKFPFTIIDPFIINDNYLTLKLRFNCLDSLVFERINYILSQESKVVDVSLVLFIDEYDFESSLRKLLLESDAAGKSDTYFLDFNNSSMYQSTEDIVSKLFRQFNENLKILGLILQSKIKTYNKLKLTLNCYSLNYLDTYITALNLFVSNFLCSCVFLKESLRLEKLHIVSNFNLNLFLGPYEPIINLKDLKINCLVIDSPLEIPLNPKIFSISMIMPFQYVTLLELDQLSVEDFEQIAIFEGQSMFQNLKTLRVSFRFEYLRSMKQLNQAILSFLGEKYASRALKTWSRKLSLFCVKVEVGIKSAQQIRAFAQSISISNTITEMIFIFGIKKQSLQIHGAPSITSLLTRILKPRLKRFNDEILKRIIKSVGIASKTLYLE